MFAKFPFIQITILILVVSWGPARAENAADEFAIAMKLAREKQYADAKKWFQLGARRHPGDKRFPLELAGIAFKNKDLEEAKRQLHRALELDRSDSYGNDFLGTIYFLQGNLEAALKYWNRIEKPRIEAIRVDPQPKTDPILLDRAFVFSPAGLLRAEEYEATKLRLKFLDVFPRMKFDLYANEAANFDVVLRAYEKSGWGSTWWEGAIRTLRGLPHQTIYPEFYNIGNHAINFESLFRWDSDQRRAYAELSAPFRTDPGKRFRVSIDGRDENWDLRQLDSSFCCFDMQTWEARFELTSLLNHAWQWSNSIGVSHRSFHTADSSLNLSPLYAEGYAIDAGLGATHYLLRDPVRRLNLEAEAKLEVSRILGDQGMSYGALRASLSGRWLPRSMDDDYKVTAALRSGTMFGDAPFDGLFTLGVDYESDLWLRAHEQLGDRKGRNPIGSTYLVVNAEIDKIVYNAALLQFRISPFVDVGRVLDAPAPLESSDLLIDTGLQFKFRVLGAANLQLTYGKDLRSGRNAFYFSASAN